LESAHLKPSKNLTRSLTGASINAPS